MNEILQDIVNLEKHPLTDPSYVRNSKHTLNRHGALIMHDFLHSSAIDSIRQVGLDNMDSAFFTRSSHTIYLSPTDPKFTSGHPRNRQIISTKGCITTDQIPEESPLKALYNAEIFRYFLCGVLGESRLYEYADDLSSINLHYASEGQELGWHFDNSSFAITLLIQKPESGGTFEYVKNVRNADAGEMNYAGVSDILDGKTSTNALSMNEGTLVLFRGRNSLHRVTPVKGMRTRMLVVLAYNTEPGISLSESARMTFYGRL